MIPYFVFLGLLLLCSLISGWAEIKVHTSYKKYDDVPNQAGITGREAAERLLRANGIDGISIGRVGGKLTDHFDPKHRVVNLSSATYNNNSVSAVAVAAHEIGHVVQQEKGYIPYKIRSAIVPIVNFGSRMAVPVVLVGLLLTLFLPSKVGEVAAYIGIVLYGLSTLFHLITLPVEVNASRRAKQMLLAEGIVAEDEKRGVTSVLSAAAMTYVAGLLTSILYFLRFILWVLPMIKRSND